ncbi:MAG: response regulator [Candidatus Gastranaerophilaceae bacterium]|jgi:pilus assembly protein CpaE
MKSRLILIDSNKESRNSIKSHLSGNQYFQVDTEADDIIKGYNLILQENPEVILIDITEKTELALEIINKLSLTNKNCVIIVTSFDDSSAIVLKAMRAGAREFITKPLDFAVLDNALEKISNILINENNKNKNGKIFTVFSNKGGIGKTSLAVNLAINLAQITKEKVALVDLNIQLGDVTTFLDLNPSFDIAYVANNLNRIDESFVLSTLEKYKDTSLYVLADPPYLEQAEEIYAEQIITVLNILKSVFSYVVIDTSANIDNKTLAALDIADTILLISMINLPCIRNTQRCMDLFEKLGYNTDKTKIIVNRYIESDEIKAEDVEETLDCSIFWKIPNNYFKLMSSINKGTPVAMLSPESNLHQSYKELAAILSNTTILNQKTKVDKKKFNFLNLFKKRG